MAPCGLLAGIPEAPAGPHNRLKFFLFESAWTLVPMLILFLLESLYIVHTILLQSFLLVLALEIILLFSF